MTTGFIIFAVVWTLAILLFIIAMIAMDLAALKKAGQNDEQTIDLGGTPNEANDFSTQHVVEDNNSGGFSFITPDARTDGHNEIAEAEETTEAVESAEQLSETSDNSERGNEDADGSEQPSESPEDNEDETDNEESEGGSIPGIRTVNYDEASEPEQKESKPFDESEAFDATLRQTHYDVKDMYEPAVSPEVQNHADTVNESMESIHTKGSSIISTDLRAAMRSRLRENQKFDLRDECNKF